MADDIIWDPYLVQNLTREETVAGIREMMQRTQLGLCGADDCEEEPTEDGIYSADRKTVLVKLCATHGEEIRQAHTRVTYDGETQRAHS